MKKITLTVILSICFAWALQAQLNVNKYDFGAFEKAPKANFQSFRFGLQLSPTVNWMKTSDKRLESAGSNLGLKLGALAELYFAPNYAVITGIGFGFNQGGAIQNGYSRGVFWPNSELSVPGLDTLPQNAKLRYHLNFVEVPIGIKFRGGTGEDSQLKFFFEAPVFTLGFITKARGDIRGVNEPTDDEDIRSDVNGLALSWGLGGGIEYEFAANATLVTGLIFQQQFTDATSNKGAAVERANGWAAEKSKGSINTIALRAAIFF